MNRLAAVLALLGACLILSNCSIKQEWSDNYTRMEGVSSTSPQMIDGDLKTVGETAMPLGAEQNFRGGPSTSEALITLPEKKMIRRVVIHSDNLMTFNIYADKQGTADNPNWQLVKEVKSVKESPIDVLVSMSFLTDKIRIIALRTITDAEDRRGGRRSRGGGGGGFGGGFGGSRASEARINEIELYGYKTGDETVANETDVELKLQ